MRYRHMRFPGGLLKAATFSYDDGIKADIRLSDIFTKHGIKATFNLNREGARAERGITSDEVREHILDKGHEVAIHGYMHRAAGLLTTTEGICEYLDSRRDLEKTYGRIIRGMAYPDSGVNRFNGYCDYSDVKDYLSKLGIVYARTTIQKANDFELPLDFHRWDSNAHHNNENIFEYIDEFVAYSAEKRYYPTVTPKLLYIWGHSYEFDNNNNWDRIERICEKLAEARDQIWFATNIEIYDYTMAYRSLVFSADSSIVYNPTLYTIWFEVDGITTNCIKPGETLKIEGK